MKYKSKEIISIIIIILLLPYVVSVFVNGKNKDSNVNSTMETSRNIEEKTVKVLVKNNVVEISWNDYLLGILAKEMPAEYEQEALKAQLILIRTRLYKEVDEYLEKGENKSDYVFQDAFWSHSDMKENWKNESHLAKIQKVLLETDNIVVKYDGKLANTPFHKCNNGSTRIGSEVLGTEEYPYLKAKECPDDVKAVNYMKSKTLSYEEVGAGVTFQDLQIVNKDTAGYATTIKVGEVTYSGEEFRTDFELPSSCIAFQDYKGKLRITTQGVGHGLGMSQYTANVFAKKGKSMEEIINYFFEGTTLEDGEDIFQKLE